MEAIAGVTVVAWLLGSAEGRRGRGAARGAAADAVREARRHAGAGGVYEGAGTLGAEALAGGAEIVRAAGVTWNIPVGCATTPPEDSAAWIRDATAAVERLLAG